MPVLGMNTPIEQSAYQKCLEVHDFVPISKTFSGEGHPDHPFTGIVSWYALINYCTVKNESLEMFWYN